MFMLPNTRNRSRWLLVHVGTPTPKKFLLITYRFSHTTASSVGLLHRQCAAFHAYMLATDLGTNVQCPALCVNREIGIHEVMLSCFWPCQLYDVPQR